MKVPEGRKIVTSNGTYRAGQELPEKHAKLLTIPVPTPAKAKAQKTSEDK